MQLTRPVGLRAFCHETAIFAKVGVKDINFLKGPVSPRVVEGE